MRILSLICLLLILVSCPTSNKDPEEENDYTVLNIETYFDIINNTDLTVDYSLAPIFIKIKVNDTTTDYIFESSHTEERYSDVFWDFSNENRIPLSGSINKQSNTKLCKYWRTFDERWSEISKEFGSFTITLKINGVEKVICGYPQGFMDHSNAIGYGVGFQYFRDAKFDDDDNRINKFTFDHYLNTDFFDKYRIACVYSTLNNYTKKYVRYHLVVTINSADDIVLSLGDLCAEDYDGTF